MTEPHADFFPFGTHYYCQPTPLPDEWEQDFANIAAAGYTHVQFRPLWRWHEHRRGQFVWDDLDRIFATAATHNLRVILKPMLENAPDWAFTELGGTRIGFHGVPLTRFAMNSAYYVGGVLPCFDNPAVMAAGLDFVRALVTRYREHPALWCYDAWNEPRSRPLAQCCCEHSTASYRRWLVDRYGDLDAINTALYKRWTDLESVIPPVSHADFIEMYLWRQWAAWAVADHVARVVAAIRATDPDHFVAVHAGGCNVQRDPAVDSHDCLQTSRAADRYGFSMNLPPAPKTRAEDNEVEYQSSWLRRVDPDYWCHEFYPHGAVWSRPLSPALLNRNLWMVLAGGASGVTFWEYRMARMGCRSPGFGMRDLDGSATATSAVCDAVAAVLRDHGPTLRRTHRPAAPIAMLFSRESDLLSRIGHMQTWMGDAQKLMPDVSYSYKRALRGAHVAWRLAGADVDWVVPGDDLADVRLLHVTDAEMLDADTAAWLDAFVRAGGTLVAEFPFATRDDKTWLHAHRPAHGLDRLLGCRESARVVCDPAVADVATFTDGTAVAAVDWRIDLAPTTAEAIARWPDGGVAATRHAVGAGTVYALGIGLSRALEAAEDCGAAAWHRQLVAAAGLPADPPGLWIRRRVGSGRTVWFAFNVTDGPLELALPDTPAAVWHNTGAIALDDRKYRLAGHSVLVLEFAIA